MTYTAPTFAPPAGNPAQLAEAAARMGELAVALDGAGTTNLSVSERLGFLTETRAGYSWTGNAAQTFAEFILERATALRLVGDALMRGAVVTAELAVALAEAQRDTAAAEAQAQARAAQAPPEAAPSFLGAVAPVVFFADSYVAAAAAGTKADAAKERAAGQFRVLLESAPHYVAPEPKPKPPAKKNRFWGTVAHKVADLNRATGQSIGADLADSIGYKLEGEDELAGYHYGRFSTQQHLIFDLGGQAPVVGEGFNLADAAMYAAEGDLTNAGISASGAVPGLGNVTTAGRLARNADEVIDIARRTDGPPPRLGSDPATTAPRGGGDGVPPVSAPGNPGSRGQHNPGNQQGRQDPPFEPQPPAGPRTWDPDVFVPNRPDGTFDPQALIEAIRRAEARRANQPPPAGSAG